MTKVSKTKALEILDRLARESEDVKSPMDDLWLKAWSSSVLTNARNLFGENSQQALDFIRVQFDPEVDWEAPSDRERLRVRATGIVQARDLIKVWRQEIVDFWADAPAPTKADPVRVALHICEALPRAVLRLRDRHGKQPPLEMKDEHDVQYVLGALLEVHFDDIHAEDYVPAYAGGVSRIDFVLRPERIAIETKMTRKSLRDKEVGEELLVDIARYKEHGKVDTLICLVYDPQHLIKNPRGLETDLERTPSDLNLRVLVRPR
jgi:hypothetical protein